MEILQLLRLKKHMLNDGQYLRNPGKYKSVSAFAPIANPMNCPWGEKAFKGYFGEDKIKWAQHDATELVQKWSGQPLDILIDVVSRSRLYGSSSTNYRTRGLQTISTSKVSSYRKTSSRLLKVRVR